ncbi:hypothetical protein D4764_0182780 [Takifugu flavidus]|uniref:Uncharacterized protein n=1 Tax=Takifugu flavidus TaxID=433684 RepID=A0A5C6MIW5_9TELE|nr:hypothetical protein D4764_0182780 [Takifugu flavidus]
MDELKLLMRIKDFSTSCVLCFTETWFRKETPDSALLLGGFQLLLLGGFQLLLLGGFQLFLLGGFQLFLALSGEKLTKPSVSTTKRWTSEAVEELRTCLDTTDWDMFKGATHDLDEYTDTVTSYIHFCEERILPTRTRVSYSNDKPWFTPKLRQIRKEKEAALKSGDRDCYREAKYRFSKELRRAKSVYSEKLQQQFTANDSASVWRGLRQITDYGPQASKDDVVLLASSARDLQ